MYPIWKKSLFLYLQFATNRMSIFLKMRPWELVENGSLNRNTLYIQVMLEGDIHYNYFLIVDRIFHSFYSFLSPTGKKKRDSNICNCFHKSKCYQIHTFTTFFPNHSHFHKANTNTLYPIWQIVDLIVL